MNDFTISAKPYLLTAVICFLVAALLNTTKYAKNKEENISPFVNTVKLTKWVGLFYLCIALLVGIWMGMWMLIDALQGNTSATALAQGAGWMVVLFIAFPVALITPVVLVYSLFVFVTDIFLWALGRRRALEIGVIKKLEDIEVFRKSARRIKFLDIAGVLAFLGVVVLGSIFCKSILVYNEGNMREDPRTKHKMMTNYNYDAEEWEKTLKESLEKIK
ncbi:MAG: hypothetical protein J6Y25_07080 [Elusimicrobiaceae bacterium]|nr:hypothetical protein [Elusimicrobiaceae bacterium]